MFQDSEGRLGAGRQAEGRGRWEVREQGRFYGPECLVKKCTFFI